MHFAWSVHILNLFLFSNPYLKFSGPVSFIHWSKLISSSSHSVMAHGCKERKKLIFRWVHIIFIIIVSENVNKLQSHWNILNWNIIMLSAAQRTSPEYFLCERFSKLNILYWSTKRKKTEGGLAWIVNVSFQHSNFSDKRYGFYIERICSSTFVSSSLYIISENKLGTPHKDLVFMTWPI